MKNLMQSLLLASACAGLLTSTSYGLEQQLAGDSWTIDPVHSSVRFTVKHMMVSNLNGQFDKVSGTVNYDGKNISKAATEATIDIDSIDTHEPRRDADLKSNNFFDAAQYPTMTFKSKKVTADKNGSFHILGTLTLHGVSKDVTLDADAMAPIIKDPHGKMRTGTSATTIINRKDFGVTYNKVMDNGGAMVGDDVKVTLDIEMTQPVTQPKS